MPDFSLVHPAYAEMLGRWQMALDFWRGGKFVLQPDHPIARYRFAAVPDATVAQGIEVQPDQAAPRSAWQWAPESWYKSYIWAHRSETANDYQERCAAAYHDPVFAPLINDVVSSILRTPPQRDGGEPWKNFWQDVDGCGTDVDPFINAAVSLAFVSGRHHVITDRPRVDQPATSRAAQAALGERSYWDPVPVTRLRNWRIDGRGNYVWIIVAEDPPDERDPGAEWKSEEQWLRVWTRGEWFLYRAPADDSVLRVNANGTSGTEKWERADQGKNAVPDRVPLSDLFVARGASRRNMACESPFASQLDLDRHLFNELTEIWECDRTQAFALLGIPEDQDGRSGAPIDIGPAKAFGFPAGTSAPAYVSPPAELTAQRWLRHVQKKAQGRSSAVIGRGAAEQSKEQRSAEAIVEEMRGQLSQMAAWAGSIQEFDRSIHRHAALANGESAESAPSANYMRSFYRMAVLSAAAALNQILASKVVSRTAAAIMVTPICQAFLADFGVPPDQIKAAEDSIKAEAEKPEPVALIGATAGPPPIPTAKVGQLPGVDVIGGGE